jgi:hypothetical protein
MALRAELVAHGGSVQFLRYHVPPKRPAQLGVGARSHDSGAPRTSLRNNHLRTEDVMALLDLALRMPSLLSLM